MHVVAEKGAFLGVHPRAGGALLNLVLDHALASPRLAKVEQVSRSPYHHEVKLAAEPAIDAELLAWIAGAYRIKTA